MKDSRKLRQNPAENTYKMLQGPPCSFRGAPCNEKNLREIGRYEFFSAIIFLILALSRKPFRYASNFSSIFF